MSGKFAATEDASVAVESSLFPLYEHELDYQGLVTMSEDSGGRDDDKEGGNEKLSKNSS